MGEDYACEECGVTNACDEDGCCISCGHQLVLEKFMAKAKKWDIAGFTYTDLALMYEEEFRLKGEIAELKDEVFLLKENNADLEFGIKEHEDVLATIKVVCDRL